jgi:hypothetical protein
MNLTTQYFRATILEEEVNLFQWEVTGRNIFHLMVLTLVYVTILMVIEYKSLWSSYVTTVYKSATSVWRGWTRNGTITGKNASSGGENAMDSQGIEMMSVREGSTGNPILDLDTLVGDGAATNHQPLPSPTVTLLQGIS